MITCFRTSMRRLLERARRFRNLLGRTGRPRAALGAAPALALAAALLLALLGASTPAGAAADSPDHKARLFVVVKEIKIHDDREGILSGQGEMTLAAQIWRCAAGTTCLEGVSDGAAVSVAYAFTEFHASSGDAVPFDRVLPEEKLGFPVEDGQQYVVRFEVDEWDDDWTDREDLGWVLHVLDTGEHGLGVGMHSARSSGGDGSGGDFTITYEIRRALLPDLRPVNIEVSDLPNTAAKRVCMAVQNIDIGQAGAFEAALRVDGQVPPGGRATALAPTPGHHVDVCVETELPTSGQHKLTAVVDEPRAVTEFDETNNVYEEQYTPSASAQADLTVGAIRVDGQVPDGKQDCRDGKNDVEVLVKNAGAADAGRFVVRLTVDGDDDASKEVQVSELKAGQERTVSLDDVPLKKGGRHLSIVADAKAAITESNETNNFQHVSATCGE